MKREAYLSRKFWHPSSMLEHWSMLSSGLRFAATTGYFLISLRVRPVCLTTNEKWKRIFGKPLFLYFLILLCASVAYAQDTQCAIKLAELPSAPELMGFRMGMTADQVRARVPQVLFPRADDFGVAKTSINPDFDPRIDKLSFPGVRTISLDFLDGRLTSLWLGFDGSFKWKTVPDFVKGISQSLRVPEAWQSWKTRGQQLRCADFQMTVSIVAEGPSFRIVDEAAENTVAARRQAKEEQDSGDEQEATEAIVADKKSKVYYPSGCEPSDEIKEADRILFGTKEEAEQAGYKAARNCRAKT